MWVAPWDFLSLLASTVMTALWFFSESFTNDFTRAQNISGIKSICLLLACAAVCFVWLTVNPLVCFQLVFSRCQTFQVSYMEEGEDQINQFAFRLVAWLIEDNHGSLEFNSGGCKIRVTRFSKWKTRTQNFLFVCLFIFQKKSNTHQILTKYKRF